jgi:2-polyprenyl-3-methyl-5-hydroxy-6-metoxy-1,4-benzoquinol methylase
MTEKPYDGTRLLDAMETAINYNNFIAQRVAAHCSHKKAVDFGAGSGTIARLLKKQGLEILCVEPDSNLRQQLEQSSFTTLTSIEEIPDGQDCIYSINVLEHIENDAQTISQLCNKLRTGGILFIYVPAFMALYSSVDKKIGHHRRYTKSSLLPLFKDMRIVRCQYSDSLGFFAGLAFKALDNGSGVVSDTAIRFYDRFAYPVSKTLDRALQNVFGKNILLVAEKN